MRRQPSLIALVLIACGCGQAQPTVCEGFDDRKLAITGAEYRPCAGEILAALDSIQPNLRAVVSEQAKGDERETARKSYGTLKTLIRQTGIENDYRSMRPASGIIKWADGNVSAFNSAAFKAMVQYMAVLAHPNKDNFDQGVRAHEEARRYYARIR